MRKKIFTLLAIFLAFTAVTVQAQTVQDTTRHEVLLETDSGDIRIELFNETPKHRDNFLRLVRSGAYDGVLFHRVIKDFMIQTGDVGSKNAKPGRQLAIRQRPIPYRQRYVSRSFSTIVVHWVQPVKAMMSTRNGSHQPHNSILFGAINSPMDSSIRCSNGSMSARTAPFSSLQRCVKHIKRWVVRPILTVNIRSSDRLFRGSTSSISFSVSPVTRTIVR